MTTIVEGAGLQQSLKVPREAQDVFVLKMWPVVDKDHGLAMKGLAVMVPAVEGSFTAKEKDRLKLLVQSLSDLFGQAFLRWEAEQERLGKI